MVVLGVVGLLSAAVGPEICTQLYVSVKPSGSYDPEPSSVIVPAFTLSWFGPASAIGGLDPTRRVPISYRMRGISIGTGDLILAKSCGSTNPPNANPTPARPLSFVFRKVSL